MLEIAKRSHSRREFLVGAGSSATFATLASPAMLRAGSHTVAPLRIRLRDDPFPFDPVTHRRQEHEFVHRAIFASLSRLNGDGWSPYLAEDIAEDHDLTGATPIFKIRISLPSGAAWHGPNQRAVTPIDIEQSILRARDAGIEVWQDVESVELTGQDTVNLVLKRRNIRLWREGFPRSVGCVTLGGLPIAKVPVDALNTNGPYMIETYEPGRVTTLYRRDNWHGNHTVVERAHLIVIPDTRAAIAAFQAGDIDILDVTEEVVGSQSQSRFSDFFQSFIMPAPTDQVYFIGMNTNSGPTENQTVRRAVSAALDRSMVTRIGFGEEIGQTAFGILPRHFAGGLSAPMEPDISIYDPERARALLAQAGYPDGFNSTMRVPVAFGPAGLVMAEIIQAQLANVGIQVEIETLDQGQAWWLRQEVQSDFFLDRTFPAYDPASSLARFQSFSPFNTPGYQSEEFDSLFENSLVAEDDERSEVLFRMQRLIEADAAVVPLAQPRNLWLVREGTVLPSFSPDGQLGDLAGFAAPT